MPPPRLHLLVCSNRRPPGGRPACGNRGANDILQALTAGVAVRPQLRASVRVTACDCLGPCFDGPNLVVYPDATWYGGVTVADIDEILDDHIVGGRPVARLMLALDDDEVPA